MRARCTLSNTTWLCVVTAIALAGLAFSSGCESDVGRSETTTKRTVETPTEKTTVTETRKKETTVRPN